MGLGRLAGPSRPYQVSISTPGKPASAVVGASGSALARLFAATASTFSLPPRIWPSVADVGSKPMVTLPPITSAIAGALPL